MQTHFIDREEESATILKIIKEAQTNTVIITVSESGIGKSSLSQKVINSLQEKLECVTVHTCPINNSIQQKEGYVFDSLFANIYNHYNGEAKNKKSKKRAFKYYFNHKCIKDIRKNIQTDMMNDFFGALSSKITIFFFFLFLLIKRFLHLDYYDIKKYINENHSKSQEVRFDYLNYLLKDCSHCICMDNLQNLDSTSYKYLEELICNTLFHRNIFIMEYTLQPNENIEKVLKIRDELSVTGASIFIYNLKKMSPECAYRTLLSRYPDIETNKKDIIDYYTLSAKGNLRRIEDFVLCQMCPTAIQGFDPTIENISKLCSGSKLIIAILALQDGKIKLDILYIIIQLGISDIACNLENCIPELLNEYRFITIEDSYVEIKHASIIDEWNLFSKKNPIYSFIAYKKLEEYYSSLIKEQKGEKLALSSQNLLNLYIKFDPIRIYQLIPLLKQIVFSNLTPKKAWTYILGFINELNQKISYFIPFLYEIIDWCCELDLILEAQLVLEMVENHLDTNKSELRYCFCFCKVNYMLGQYNKVIDFCLEKKQKTQTIEELFYYYLFLIISFRSLNRYDDMNSIVNIIKSDNSYSNLQTYGLFLRLSEVYMDKSKSEKTIEKSVVFFQQHNLIEQAAKSNITLSYIYAINGKTQDSLHVLKAAEAILNNENSLSHIFRVNKACISILEGEINYNTWILLDSAEKIVENAFNQLAITNNKIICCIEGINSQQKNYLEKKAIKLLGCVPDKHMHAILSYNLYLLFVKDNPKKAKYYLSIAEKNHCYCESLSKRLGKNTHNPKDTVSQFLLTKPWHVCFLSCWEFDFIPSKLE